MRKRNYKGRCEKRIVEKSKEVCRTYDEIQKSYLDACRTVKRSKRSAATSGWKDQSWRITPQTLFVSKKMLTCWSGNVYFGNI